MSTVNEIKRVLEMVASEDVVSVTEYTNAWGGQSFGVVFKGQRPDTYKPTQWVINPKTIWTAEKGWLDNTK